MTVDNAEVNISPLIQSSEDSKNETSEKEAVDEEVLSESIDKSKPYMQTSSEYDNTGNYVITAVVIIISFHSVNGLLRSHTV
jgi:hypothetical protein